MKQFQDMERRRHQEEVRLKEIEQALADKKRKIYEEEEKEEERMKASMLEESVQKEQRE